MFSNIPQTIEATINVESLSLQQIFYGAPGKGKSHKIKDDAGVKAADEKNLVFRTTFHPDNGYSTFVEAYKPTMDKRAVRNVAGDIVKNTDKEEVYEDCIKCWHTLYYEGFEEYNGMECDGILVGAW